MMHKSTALKLKVKNVTFFGVWQISTFAAFANLGYISVIIIRNYFLNKRS